METNFKIMIVGWLEQHNFEVGVTLDFTMHDFIISFTNFIDSVKFGLVTYLSFFPNYDQLQL